MFFAKIKFINKKIIDIIAIFVNISKNINLNYN